MRTTRDEGGRLYKLLLVHNSVMAVLAAGQAVLHDGVSLNKGPGLHCKKRASPAGRRSCRM